MTTISGFDIFYPDKEATQRIGVQPDIYIDPTIEGIREGRDELIEKAIKLLKKGFENFNRRIFILFKLKNLCKNLNL